MELNEALDGARTARRREFLAKLRAVAADVPYLRKDGRNDFQKYNYVSEAAVKAHMREALAKHELTLDGSSVTLAPGSNGNNAACVVELRITDGEFTATFAGAGGDADKSGKAVQKATAAAIKYALTTAFLIPTGDDPEASQDGEPTDKRKRGKTGIGGGGEEW